MVTEPVRSLLILGGWLRDVKIGLLRVGGGWGCCRVVAWVWVKGGRWGVRGREDAAGCP
jgi:hypothetical protein